MGISTLKQASDDVKRGLKSNGLEEHEKLLKKAILERFLKDTFEVVTDFMRENSEKSFLLMTHEEMIPEISYGIVILEDANNFYIHLFKD